MVEIFETLETVDIDMNPSHSMIGPIVNRNFGNTFQHQIELNQHQHTHKSASQKYQHKKIDNSTSTETLINSINT